MQQKRAQRFASYVPMQIGATANQDSISYDPGSSKITLGIYPRLGSPFPELPKIEVPLRSGAKAPPNLPLTRGGFSLREVGNEVFVITCIGISGGILEVPKGVPTTNYQAIGIVSKRSGEVVSITVGAGEGDVSESHAQFAKYAVWKMDFDRKAKPIESKNLITHIREVDVSTLTHTWTATVRVPGSGEYRLEGNVRDGIRNKGGVPNGSFSYWKQGWTWVDGDRIGMIAEDFSGKYHAAVFSSGGGHLFSEANCNGLQAAIETVNRLIQHSQQ